MRQPIQFDPLDVADKSVENSDEIKANQPSIPEVKKIKSPSEGRNEIKVIYLNNIY